MAFRAVTPRPKLGLTQPRRSRLHVLSLAAIPHWPRSAGKRGHPTQREWQRVGQADLGGAAALYRYYSILSWLARAGWRFLAAASGQRDRLGMSRWPRPFLAALSAPSCPCRRAALLALPATHLAALRPGNFAALRCPPLRPPFAAHFPSAAYRSFSPLSPLSCLSFLSHLHS